MRIVIAGDSISTNPYNVPGFVGWPLRFQQLMLSPGLRQPRDPQAGWELVSAAVGSTTFASWSVDGVAAARIGGRADILIAQLGTNDLLVDNVAIAVLRARALAFWTLARAAAQPRVLIAGTIPPFGNALPEPQRRQFNADLFAGLGAGLVDVVADAAAAIQGPAPTPLGVMSPWYNSGDFIHPNDLGAQALGDIYWSAMMGVPTRPDGQAPWSPGNVPSVSFTGRP